jgi:serine protease Do
MAVISSRGTLLALLLAPGALLAAPPPSPARAGARLVEVDAELRALAGRVTPSVVQVLVSGFAAAPSGATSVLAAQRSSGSGVVVDAEGYIVTSAHVVRGARRIEVLRSPRREGPGGSILRPAGRPLPAAVVGVDRETDLALLKVEAEGLVPLPFADSEELRQGQVVLAFGSPLGLDNTVTLGVLSALARQLTPDDPMIYLQTDAPINPGSSGGPLVDVEGRLVGINTLIVSQGGGNEGIGFAAPANIVKAVVKGLRREGRLRRGWIGAHAQTVTPLLARGLSLPDEAAVILSDVVADTPAARAELRIGDLLTAMDGRPLDNARQFDVRLYRVAPGETVRIELLRDGRRLTAEVPVVERPGDPDRFASLVTPERNLVARLGILGIELDDAVRQALSGLRGEAGVLVAARSAGSGEDGLQVGDVIYALNGVSVRGLAELRQAVDGAAAGSALVFQVERDGKLLYVGIEAP